MVLALGLCKYFKHLYVVIVSQIKDIEVSIKGGSKEHCFKEIKKERFQSTDLICSYVRIK